VATESKNEWQLLDEIGRKLTAAVVGSYTHTEEVFLLEIKDLVNQLKSLLIKNSRTPRQNRWLSKQP
jgi:hypothetical protein